MISRGLRQRRLVTATGLAGLLLTAGCQSGGGSEDAASDPTGDASSATSAPVPVPEPTPTAEPADGKRVSTEGATIRVLQDMRRVSDFGVLQGYRNDQAYVTFLPGYTDKPSLDAFARQELRIERQTKPDVERLDDVVVGGKYNAFHLLDTSDKTQDTHVFGLMFLDGSWIINIGFYNSEVGDAPVLDDDEREQVVQSILATFEPTFA